MVGTFGGALEARKINASEGRLTADVRGEVEVEEGVLVIRRVHITMRLKAPSDAKETAERVHSIFANNCPVYRSLKRSIEITSSLVVSIQT